MHRFIYPLLLILHLTYYSTAQTAFVDTTFGTNGFVTENWNTSTNLAHISNILVQPDHKILVRSLQVTDPNGNKGLLRLSRYLENGAPDLAFGNNGTILLNQNSTMDYLGRGNQQLILLDDGKILTAFARFANDSLKSIILKFDDNGHPDPTFGSNGRIAILEKLPVNAGHNPALFDILLVSNGKIMLFYQSFPYYTDFGFREINANGSLPNNSEVLWWQTDPADELAHHVVIQPDNRILVGGRVVNHDAISFSYDMLMARFDPDGYIDESFGVQGFVRKDISGGYDVLTDFILLPTGKILGVGVATDFKLFLVRLNSDGSADNSFGNNGVGLYPNISNLSYFNLYISPLPDNRFVIAINNQGNNSKLLRFMENGDIDPSFNGGQPLAVPTPPDASEFTVQDIVALPDYRMLVCGVSTGNPTKMVLSRLLPQANAVPWYRDMDQDGFGKDNEVVYAADQPVGYSALGGDCNDLNLNIYPEAVELCNGIDDSCDGLINEVPNVVCIEQTVVKLNQNGIVNLTPENYWVPNFGTPCNDIASVSLNITSFDCSGIGEHIVVLTATSSQGGTNSCTLKITVVDKTAPTAVCTPTLNVVIDDTGLYTLTPGQLDAGSTDNCGIAEYGINPPQFSVSDIGVQTIVFIVVDASGNSSSCITIANVSETSATKDNAEDLQSVVLTPNPAKDQVFLKIPNTWQHETVNLQILDTQGRVLWQNTGFVSPISIEQWPAGHYYLRLEKGGASRIFAFEKVK
jgi:uncharacterized delta-60 repeat protein